MQDVCYVTHKGIITHRLRTTVLKMVTIWMQLISGIVMLLDKESQILKKLSHYGSGLWTQVLQ